jgi:hypothetical protein
MFEVLLKSVVEFEKSEPTITENFKEFIEKYENYQKENIAKENSKYIKENKFGIPYKFGN